MVPCTWRAPAPTPARELATPQPESSWVWIPIVALPPSSSTTAAVARATAAVVDELGGSATIGIHTHDDSGCGVANSLAGVGAGARQVQGTINGYGERCGNANLTTIVPDLQLKLGYDCVPPEHLASLTETAHRVDEICNVTPNPNQPYVGRNAFAHKGGMHVAAIVRDARTFEHVDPGSVGADRTLLISELSGKGTVQARAEQAGIPLAAEEATRVVERVKDLESRGFHFEAADGSFDLPIRRETGVSENIIEASWEALVDSLEAGMLPSRSGHARPASGQPVARR